MSHTCTQHRRRQDDGWMHCSGELLNDLLAFACSQPGRATITTGHALMIIMVDHGPLCAVANSQSSATPIPTSTTTTIFALAFLYLSRVVESTVPNSSLRLSRKNFRLLFSESPVSPVYALQVLQASEVSRDFYSRLHLPRTQLKSYVCYAHSPVNSDRLVITINYSRVDYFYSLHT